MDRRHLLFSLAAGGGFALAGNVTAFAASTPQRAVPGAAVKRKRILFDSKGAQIQQNRQTRGRRLTTFFGLLKNFPYDPATGALYSYSLSNPRLPLTPPLWAAGADVLVILTHQRSPEGTQLNPPAFRFSQTDLDGIPAWVAAGGGLLLISNHGGFDGKPAYWPNNDEKLAARFGITIVPAAFAYGPPRQEPPAVCTSGDRPLIMAPEPTAPPALAKGVSRLSVWDACGISAPTGDVVFKLPADCSDQSGLGYRPADYCFCLATNWGKGKLVVLSHSGIVGNQCTPQPS